MYIYFVIRIRTNSLFLGFGHHFRSFAGDPIQYTDKFTNHLYDLRTVSQTKYLLKIVSPSRLHMTTTHHILYPKNKK